MTEIATQEAAELVGVSDQTIRDWCDKGLVKHRRIGLQRIYRVDRDDLLRLARELGYVEQK